MREIIIKSPGEVFFPEYEFEKIKNILAGINLKEHKDKNISIGIEITDSDDEKVQVSFSILAFLRPEDFIYSQIANHTSIFQRDELLHVTHSLQSATAYAIRKFILDRRFVIFGKIIYKSKPIFTACVVYFEQFNISTFSAINEVDIERNIAILN